MSFLQDFRDTVHSNTQTFKEFGHVLVPAHEYDQHKMEILVFESLARLMGESTIIRLRGDQSEIFLETPIDEHQDFIQWLRLPYPNIYIQLEQPFRFHGYMEPDVLDKELQQAKTQEERNRLRAIRKHGDPLVRGAVITDITQAVRKVEEAIGDDSVMNVKVVEWERLGIIDFPVGESARILHIVFLMPIPEFFMNVHSFTITVTRDNQLFCAKHTSQDGTLTRAKQWLVNLVNFLSSPTVKLVRNEPDASLQKARQRRGKPPLAGWYEISFRRQLKEYTKDKKSTQMWHHSFRYSVIGHFRRYAHGRMAGRVIWVSAHERGLANKLFKPKGYREEGLSAQKQ